MTLVRAYLVRHKPARAWTHTHICIFKTYIYIAFTDKARYCVQYFTFNCTNIVLVQELNFLFTILLIRGMIQNYPEFVNSFRSNEAIFMKFISL